MRSSLLHLLGLLAIAPAFAETTASPAAGAVGATLSVGLAGSAFPLIEADVSVGVAGVGVATVDGSGNARLSLPVAAQTSPASVLVAGTAYYLEVISGALEGERYEVDVATTLTLGAGRVALDLTSPRSTASTVVLASLNGCGVAIRPHLTLAKIQAMFSPALVGNNNAALADALLVYGGSGFTTYYLRGDNLAWRKAGSTTDYAAMVIAPDDGVLVQLRSGSKVMTHFGLPRMNDFRLNLKSGYTVGSTGYAVDLSPLQFGAIINAGPAPQHEWIGNNLQSSADGMQLFDPAKRSFTSYYLRSDGVSWRTPGSTSVLTNTALLKPSSYFIIKRTNSNPNYLVLRPY
jgi:hypothetical protein